MNPYSKQQPGPGYQSRVEAQPMKSPDRPKMQEAPKSGGGGMLGGLLSDKNSKKEISRLEQTNDALTKALDSSAARTGEQGAMPPTQYPSLAANTRVQPSGGGGLGPLQARFPDSPAAQAVASQNAALLQPQGQARPAPGVPSAPGTSQARPVAPQWNPTAGTAPPDMAALDEAYRRIGASQGG